jgi:hypothetical protein
MTHEDRAGSPALSARTRAHLERLAYARPATRHGEVAAENALRRLVEADEAAAIATRPATPVLMPKEGVHPTSLVESMAVEEPPPGKPIALRSRRPRTPLVVAVCLVIGLAAGIVAARATPTLFSAAPTATPDPTGTLFTAFAPQALSVTEGSGDMQAATTALDASQTPGDVLPVEAQASRLGILPASVHRVLTTADGLTLWIARSSGDICLIYTGGTGQLGGAANCLSPSEFTQTGVTLQAGPELWSWNGASFTVAISN